MMCTDNPVRDAGAYFDDLEDELEKMPVCSECGEHIQQDEAVYIGGNWYCDGCIDKCRVSTEVF